MRQLFADDVAVTSKSIQRRVSELKSAEDLRVGARLKLRSYLLEALCESRSYIRMTTSSTLAGAPLV